MNITTLQSTIKTISSELVTMFVFQDEKLFAKQSLALKECYGTVALSAVSSKEFSGKENETVLIYTEHKKTPRLFVIGLGDSQKFTIEKLRRAVAAAAKKGKALKVASMAIEMPNISEVLAETIEVTASAMAEASLLSLYKYDKYLSNGSNGSKLSTITFFSGSSYRNEIAAGIKNGRIIAEATMHARDLSNAPGNELYPETLAKDAQQMGKKHGYSVTVFDKKKIQLLGMGGVIGVSNGSAKDPRFIIMEYGKRFKKHGTVALVGKGVTFDSGGISIKPSANMAEMKMDMSGAAAVIGTMNAVADLKLKRHMIGLIPSVENMLSGSAVKPGDIIRHYNGKTSEVDNTDAEGRLILADALSYAETFKPELVIDLATLTGACVVALGHYASGMMGNDQETMDALRIAGDTTYDRVWQLPMYDEYEKLIKSDIADIKNVGGRWAGAITAGWFLKQFIGKYKWVHLDIAGTAIQEEHQAYIPRGGSGAGVRLLIEYLRNNN
ncbi:MAG: leucyl aminopeptidase [Bacteriovoracaceae bacterium]